MITTAQQRRYPYLRVGTWNVHQWHNDYDQICDLLLQHSNSNQLDVIGLQECTKDKLPLLAKSLGMSYYRYTRSVAIISTYEILELDEEEDYSSTKLSPTLLTKKELQQQNNNMKVCRVGIRFGYNNDDDKMNDDDSSSDDEDDCCDVVMDDDNNGTKGSSEEKETASSESSSSSAQEGIIYITCIHFDHRKESTRMKQISLLTQKQQQQQQQQRKTTTTENIMNMGEIWIGDFNALTRSDYTDQEWKNITEIRQLNSWEPPMTNVTDYLTNHDDRRKATAAAAAAATTTRTHTKKKKKKSNRKRQSNTNIFKCTGAQAHNVNPGIGDSNSYNNSNGFGFLDAWQIADSSGNGGIICNGPKTTSRFQTRIDYIFVSPTFYTNWDVISCQHVEAIKPNISDHNLVIAQFKIKFKQQQQQQQKPINRRID